MVKTKLTKQLYIENYTVLILQKSKRQGARDSLVVLICVDKAGAKIGSLSSPDMDLPSGLTVRV